MGDHEPRSPTGKQKDSNWKHNLTIYHNLTPLDISTTFPVLSYNISFYRSDALTIGKPLPNVEANEDRTQQDISFPDPHRLVILQSYARRVARGVG